MSSTLPTGPKHTVDMPAGGSTTLHNEAEVELWTSLSERYRSDYRLTKINDLVQLGSLLIQNIALFRAQRALSGIVEVTDDEGLRTGAVEHRELKPAEVGRYNDEIRAATKEIRDIEKAMGIDKKSREAGGSETVRDYVTRLKRLGHEYGIHIAERVKAYEEFAMEMRWRVRVNENADAEDRAYSDCTPEAIIAWASAKLAELEEVDRRFAEQQGKLAVGGRRGRS